MTYTAIANDIKTIIDATTWTTPSQGVLKNTYVWVKSHNRSLNLNNPNLWNADGTAIIVIYPGQIPIQLGVTTGSKIYSFQGIIKMYTKSDTDMENAIAALDAISNGNNALSILIPDYDGDPEQNNYWCQIIYKYIKNILF